MVLAQQLTPETFLSLPRRGAAVPNSASTLALYHVSRFELGMGMQREWRLMDLSSGNSWQLTDDKDVYEAQWLPGHADSVAWLRSVDGGATELVLVRIDATRQLASRQILTRFNGTLKHMKLKSVDEWHIAFTAIGPVGYDGRVCREQVAGRTRPAGRSRGLESSAARLWKEYTIFYSVLVKQESGQLAMPRPLLNAVRRSGREAPGDIQHGEHAAGDYDVTKMGIVFVACNPRSLGCQGPRPPRNVSSVFFVYISSWDGQPDLPERIVMQSDQPLGYASNPRFSPDGFMVSYLHQPLTNPAENRLFTGHISSFSSFDVWSRCIGSSWDLRPARFEYARGGQALFILADQCGRRSLYELQLRHLATPRLLVEDWSVHGFHPLNDTELLVSASSIVDNSLYMIVDGTSCSPPRVISSATRHGRKLCLSHSQVSESWVAGSEESNVHAWFVKPWNFDPQQKWPVVLLLHGGVEDAARDGWAWRWNPALWAERGFVVVCPELERSGCCDGSAADRVDCFWADRPCKDLESCLRSLDHIPYIDTDRAVLAGGGCGAYVASQVWGGELARKFKAVICRVPTLDVRHPVQHPVQHPSMTPGRLNGVGGPSPDGRSALPGERLRGFKSPYHRISEDERDIPLVIVTDNGGYPRQFVSGFDRHASRPEINAKSAETLQSSWGRGQLVRSCGEEQWSAPEDFLTWHKMVFEWLRVCVGQGPTGAKTAQA